MHKISAGILSWLTTLLIPIVLLGLALRVLLTPLFLQIEYRLPYFPPDEYGFSTTDRLHYAPYALHYLLNDEDISYLGDLTFADGEALFNPRELSHMQDVRGVTLGSLRLWYTTLVIVGMLAVWSRLGKWWQVFLRGLKRGGWLTVSLVLAVGLFAAMAFWQFFTIFHSLFFEGDSWLFLYSDTLIRLFPIRFWQDVFLDAALIAAGGGLAIGLGLKPKV